MKLKLDENGAPVLDGDDPVYVTDDGTEKPVNVGAMAQALEKANAEAAKRRLALEQAEAKLKLYKGLDAKTAREAIAFREALGDDVDPQRVSTEIASLKAERAGLASQVEELQGKMSAADATIDKLTLGSQIQGSEFINTKVAPALRDPHLFRAAYGDHLGRDEHGNVVVKDQAGNTIMSDSNPGQPASLDEALPKLVTNPRHLAAGNASGGGERPNASGNGHKPGAKKWADMSREEQMAFVREADGDMDKVRELVGQ